jgi:hypothetical protein
LATVAEGFERPLVAETSRSPDMMVGNHLRPRVHAQLASRSMRISPTIKRHLSVGVLTAALAIQACRSDSGEVFEVIVWFDGPASEEDFLPHGDVFDGPCGLMRRLKVHNLRELSGAEHDSLERVLEFAEDGEVISEWLIPVESNVTAIDVEWLTVNTSDGHVSINQKGDIRRADSFETREDHEYFGACPNQVLKDFLGPTGESDYLACWRLRDGATAKTRFLAYQGVCT